MYRTVISTALCGFVISLIGCGGAPSDPLKREAISGKVTLDGKPVDEGAISFQPDIETAAKTATGGVITAGAYQIPKEGGLAPGNYRVSITSPEPAPKRSGDDEMNNPSPPRKERVAPKFNLKSELQATVKASGPNKFDFTVTSK